LNKKLNIAHFPGSFLPVIGGAEIVVHNLAKFQAMHGDTVHVYSDKKSVKFFQKNKIQAPYQIKHSLTLVLRIIKRLNRLGVPFDFEWILASYVKKIQKTHKYDVWHFNLIGENAFILIPILNKLGIPIIGTFHGNDIQIYPEVDYGLRRNNAFDQKVRKVIGLFDVVTAISDSVKEEYVKLGVPNENIRLIPNGINLDMVNEIKVDSSALRKELGWPTNKKIILTVGRNHPKKGYANIPLIIKTLLKFRNDFLWVIIGKGCENIIFKAKELGVDQYLMIMGELGGNLDNGQIEVPSKAIIEAYKSADVLCFPTIVETFGNIFIEAMATGLPIVTTNAPGARDLVTHEYNGLQSNINDIESITHNIERVFQEKSLRVRLKRNGLDSVAQYDWQLVIKKYGKAYYDVIDCKDFERNKQKKKNNIKKLIIRVTDAYPPPWTGLSPGPFYLSEEQSQDKDYDLIVIAKFRPSCEVVDANANHKIIRLRSRSLFFGLSAFFQIIKINYKRKIYVVHSHGQSLSEFQWLIQNFLKVRTCVTLHIVRKTQFRFMRSKNSVFWVKRLIQTYREWISIKHSDKVFTVSSSLKNEIIAEYRSLNCDIQVVGNGVGNSFIPNMEDLLKDRKNNHKEGRMIRILFIGVLNGRKDVGALLEAFSIVKSFCNNNCKLHVVGDGKHRGKYIIQSKKLGIKSNVTFTKNINHSDLPKVYLEYDIFVLPTFNEGLPKVLIEAMAAGLPVIVSDIPPIREIITNNVNGLLFQNKDKKSLSSCILKLTNSPKLRFSLGISASNLVRERYTWPKVCKKYKEGYKSITQEREIKK
jgi:glycosyltransferase involved in cell wall biosynthesis